MYNVIMLTNDIKIIIDDIFLSIKPNSYSTVKNVEKEVVFFPLIKKKRYKVFLPLPLRVP